MCVELSKRTTASLNTIIATGFRERISNAVVDAVFWLRSSGCQFFIDGPQFALQVCDVQ